MSNFSSQSADESVIAIIEKNLELHVWRIELADVLKAAVFGLITFLESEGGFRLKEGQSPTKTQFFKSQLIQKYLNVPVSDDNVQLTGILTINALHGLIGRIAGNRVKRIASVLPHNGQELSKEAIYDMRESLYGGLWCNRYGDEAKCSCPKDAAAKSELAAAALEEFNTLGRGLFDVKVNIQLKEPVMGKFNKKSAAKVKKQFKTEMEAYKAAGGGKSVSFGEHITQHNPIYSLAEPEGARVLGVHMRAMTDTDWLSQPAHNGCATSCMDSPMRHWIKRFVTANSAYEDYHRQAIIDKLASLRIGGNSVDNNGN